jgi:predicted anti-sigma-YlaC factor YlaD
MMNCKQAKKYFIFHIENEIDPGEAHILEGHLSACENCRALYNKLKSSVAMISAEKQVVMNPYFYNRIELKLEKLNEDSQQKAPIFLRALKPVLLVLLIVISSTIGLVVGSMGQQEESIPANSNTVISEIASQYQLNLSQEETLENYYNTK